MSCNTVQTKLSAYLDGEMSGAEMLLTRSHVNSCEKCQRELDSLKSAQIVLRSLPVVPEPSPMLPSMIMEKVTSERRGHLRLGLTLALALPVIAFLAIAMNRPTPRPVPDRNVAINQQLANDQVYDAGNDSTSGASLVHYTNYEGR